MFFVWPTVLYIIGTLVALGLVNLLTPFESALARPLERTMYVAVVLAGLAFAALDIREGYSLNRPKITREQSPFMFWVEVVVALALSVVGVVKLWQS